MWRHFLRRIVLPLVTRPPAHARIHKAKAKITGICTGNCCRLLLSYKIQKILKFYSLLDINVQEIRGFNWGLSDASKVMTVCCQSALIIGLPKYLIRKPQMVLDTAARVLRRIQKYDHNYNWNAQATALTACQNMFLNFQSAAWPRASVHIRYVICLWWTILPTISHRSKTCCSFNKAHDSRWPLIPCSGTKTVECTALWFT